MISPRNLEPVRPTILVANNEGEMLESLVTHLQDAGYSVVTATDGLTALRSVEEKRPDLLVLDLDLPVMSGFRLAQLIRRDSVLPSLPMIVVTDYPFQAAKEIVDLGVDAFVEKPFEVVTLLQAVHSSLDGQPGRVQSAAPASQSRPSGIWARRKLRRRSASNSVLTNRTNVRIMSSRYRSLVRTLAAAIYLLPTGFYVLFKWISRISLPFSLKALSRKSMPPVG